MKTLICQGTNLLNQEEWKIFILLSLNIKNLVLFGRRIPLELKELSGVLVVTTENVLVTPESTLTWIKERGGYSFLLVGDIFVHILKKHAAQNIHSLQTCREIYHLKQNLEIYTKTKLKDIKERKI
ncbi:hypothetical protein HZS_7390 [Henneguya salminicola]|nr:hypothetical protein HZS_7390 [Henneguya salminicola]